MSASEVAGPAVSGISRQPGRAVTTGYIPRQLNITGRQDFALHSHHGNDISLRRSRIDVSRQFQPLPSAGFQDNIFSPIASIAKNFRHSQYNTLLSLPPSASRLLATDALSPVAETRQ